MEEVKLAIKPFYAKGQISKDEYKDIMRKAVPKVTITRGFNQWLTTIPIGISVTEYNTWGFNQWLNTIPVGLSG